MFFIEPIEQQHPLTLVPRDTREIIKVEWVAIDDPRLHDKNKTNRPSRSAIKVLPDIIRTITRTITRTIPGNEVVLTDSNAFVG